MKPGFPVVPQPMVTLFPKFGLQMILEASRQGGGDTARVKQHP